MTPAQRGAANYAERPKGLIARRKGAATSHANKRAIIIETKSRPCADCGLTFDPVCMDFDHRPNEIKVRNVSKMGLRSRAALLSEIAKCDVVCSNCHRIRTRDRNQYRRRPAR